MQLYQPRRRSRRTRLRTPLALALALAVPLAATGCSAERSTGADSEDALTIGVFEVAQAGLIDDAVKAFEAELTDELAPRKVRFEVKNANGDQGLISGIARDFAGADYDAYAVIGTPAVTALATQVRDKPIFAIAMGDPVGAKVAESLDEPGGNVTGSIDYVDPAVLLDVLGGSDPAPKRIGTIYDPSNQNMTVWSRALHTAAEKRGLEVVEATISGPNDVTAAARSLDGRVDAVLTGPDATVTAGIEAVGAVAAQARVPLYVVGGDTSVPGVAASIGPAYTDLGALAGRAAAKVLDGKEPALVPFGRPEVIETAVSQKTLTELGISLDSGIIEAQSEEGDE